MPRTSARRLTDKGISKLPAAPAGKRSEYPDALAAGLILRVNDKGGRRWEVRFRADGKQGKMSLGAWPGVSLAEARQRAREVRELAEQGVDPRAAAGADAAAARLAAETFGDLAEKFLAEWQPRSADRARWQAGTIRNHLQPLFPVRLGDLHRRQLGDIVAELRDPNRPGGARPGAARNAFESAIQITRWAVRRGHLESDPFVNAEPPPKGAPKDRVLADNEMLVVWLAAEARGHPWGNLVKLILLTGCRRAEAAGMVWAELDDPDAPTVWSLPPERAKNGTGLAIPLSAPARALIADLPRLSGAYIFSTTAGEKPVSGFSRALAGLHREAEQVAAELGVDAPAPWGLHDLRRTARTLLARVGVPDEVAERCIGHVGGSQLLRTYNRHKYTQEMADAFERLGREVLRIAEGRESSAKVLKLR